MDTSPIISSLDHSAVSTKVSQLERKASSFEYELQQAIKHGDSYTEGMLKAKISKLDIKLQQLKSVGEVQQVSPQAQNAGAANINNSQTSSANSAVDTARGTSIDVCVV